MVRILLVGNQRFWSFLQHQQLNSYLKFCRTVYDCCAICFMISIQVISIR